jgi:hypothetical protein
MIELSLIDAMTQTPKKIPSHSPLDYASPMSQRGVTVVSLEDGARIMVPMSAMPQHGLRLFHHLFLMLWQKVFGEWLPQVTPRAMITVEGGKLTIRENNGENTQERSWPADELTECRPNRFQRSLFLRIPGKEATDVLENLDEELLQFIADQLRPHLPNVT